MIRQGTIADVGRVLSMGQAMVAESPYGPAFNNDKVAKKIRWVVENGIAIMYEFGGEVRGMFLGYVAPTWFSDELVGWDLAFYIEPRFRSGRVAVRLLEEWEKQCASKGAKALRPITSCGSFTSERLFASRGYTPIGSSFVKDL